MPLGYYRLRRNSKKEFYLSGPINGESINSNNINDFREAQVKAERLSKRLKTKIIIKRIPEEEYDPKTIFKFSAKKKRAPINLSIPPSFSYSEVYEILEKWRQISRANFNLSCGIKTK